MAAIQNVGLFKQIWVDKIIGVCYWCVKIPQCGYMEHGLKHITFYVQKYIAPLAMCHNPAIVHDKPLGAPASVKLVYWMLPLQRTEPLFSEILRGISPLKSETSIQPSKCQAMWHLMAWGLGEDLLSEFSHGETPHTELIEHVESVYKIVYKV